MWKCGGLIHGQSKYQGRDKEIELEIEIETLLKLVEERIGNELVEELNWNKVSKAVIKETRNSLVSAYSGKSKCLQYDGILMRMNHLNSKDSETDDAGVRRESCRSEVLETLLGSGTRE